MLKYLCAPLALLVLTAAGCGGGGPTKEEYAADLDEVCKKSERKIAKLPRPRSLQDTSAFVRFADEAKAITAEAIREAERLELPEEDAEGFKRYLAESKASLGPLDDIARAARESDEKEILSIYKRVIEENRKRDVQAKSLGLKECGSG